MGQDKVWIAVEASIQAELAHRVDIERPPRTKQDWDGIAESLADAIVSEFVFEGRRGIVGTRPIT